MKSLVQVVLETAKLGDIHDNNRTPETIMFHVMEEIGELSTEINIAAGRSYKQPSADGIVGESIDAIVALLDVIYKHQPDITEEEIVKIASLKCRKWIDKIAK